MVQAAHDVGLLFRKSYGRYDLTTPNDEIAVAWGAPRSEPPRELMSEAEKVKLRSAARVKNYSDAAHAIRKYLAGVVTCSPSGYVDQRDENGLCRIGRDWGHCTYFRGAGTLKANRTPFLAIQQSWGTISPTGNDRVKLYSGREITLPPGVFLITADQADDHIRRGGYDTWAVQNLSNFTKRKIDLSSVLG
jgi:hypothetical protein